MKIIHIGFGDSAARDLQEAIDNHGLVGDVVIPTRDDFTQGPISECDTSIMTSQRPDYWKMIDAEIHFGMNVDEFYEESMSLLDEVVDVEVVIWQGDSCHDILASAWLMTYLKNRNLKWTIIDLARLSPEDINDGLPPVNIAMFSPDQIASLYTYKQSIGEAALQIYQDLWAVIKQENGDYRVKIGSEISSVDANYHDAFILSLISKEWTVASEAIGIIMTESEHRLSDTTVEWRIRQLIKVGKIEYKGELMGMKEYSIRLNPNYALELRYEG